jgi:hypothetical protein
MFTPSLAINLRNKINTVFYEGRVEPRHTEFQHFYADVEDGQVYSSVTTKTSLLSRAFYKQMAADKAVDHIQSNLANLSKMEPEEIVEVFNYAREAHVHDLKKAGNWGTHGHDLVDKYMNMWIETGEKPVDIRAFIIDETSNEGICAGLSAVKFIDSYTMFPVVSEKKVLSKRYGYAGTLDSLWLIGEVYKGREGKLDCVHNWMEKGIDKIGCAKCNRQERLILTLCDWKTSNQIFGIGPMSKFDYALQVMAYDMAMYEMTRIRSRRQWIIRLDKQKPHFEVGVIADPKAAAKAFIAINEVSLFASRSQPPLEPLIKKNIITL